MHVSQFNWLQPRSTKTTLRPLSRTRLGVLQLEDRTVPSSVQGVMFDDANRNGAADAGEAGLVGCTVFLDVNRDGVQNVGETSTVTDGSGAYAFDTTFETPAVVGATTGHQYDFVAIALLDGRGADGLGAGRWMNTTATFAIVNRTTDPAAQRNFGAYFQPFAGAGVQPVGTETPASVATAGAQSNAVVAADAIGNYVVAWRTTNADGTGTVLARVFNANGTARTSELVVATATGAPEVAMSGDGSRIVVAWSSYNAITRSSSTSYRVYSGAGAAVTGAVLIGGGTATTSMSLDGVATGATGNSVVLYRTSTFNKSFGWSGPALKAQRYTANGSANGGAISVASPNLINGAASVAMDGAGNFVAVWDDTTSKGVSTVVNFQRYDTAGRKAGGLITVASGGLDGGNAVKYLSKNNAVFSSNGSRKPM